LKFPVHVEPQSIRPDPPATIPEPVPVFETFRTQTGREPVGDTTTESEERGTTTSGAKQLLC
jgi:hypothetical protein